MNLTVAIVNFLYVAKMICDSRVFWTVYKWEATTLHAGTLVQWFCYFFKDKPACIVVSGILFGVMQPSVAGQNGHLRFVIPKVIIFDRRVSIRNLLLQTK